jgi:hypothetical protein
MWQSKREISRECNDIIGSAKGSQISEKYWGEVGKGKRVDVYLEVRKRRGHIFFEWNKCLWSEVRMAGIYGTFGNAERLLTCKTLECLSNFKSITSISVSQGVLIFKRTTSVASVTQGDFGSPSMWIWILSIYLVVAIYRIRQPLDFRNYDKFDLVLANWTNTLSSYLSIDIV